ncbi:MAG: hypothetical protein L6R39_000518 [Caloplaca ligustica]|nr:MAG: hypothetical protein L6R39_000518 [Caloplaca ligustica]
MAASVTKSLQQLAHSKGVPLSGLQPEDDKDVLFTTGPMRWSQEVFPYLSSTSDTEVTHRNFTGLKEPRVFRGVMILPINAFASDLGHSGSRISVTNETLVWHSFQGAWKSEEKVSEDKETGKSRPVGPDIEVLFIAYEVCAGPVAEEMLSQAFWGYAELPARAAWE